LVEIMSCAISPIYVCIYKLQVQGTLQQRSICEYIRM
jgi:hypothetical protein